MHYVIHALDKPDALPIRLANYEAHKAYLAKATVKTVISGPLVADDGETMIGSCFVVEADSKDEVLAFHNADPFKAAGVWEHVHINPFLKRVDNR
ncbi:YciI family protein [Lichenifustis flavocetrariae]|uniref:YciI family protein n=1 Tax=Lichenifustis flavocetrariae TaxID=2949735 RepID=A0AA41YVB8_9HYPH|nr:YciI family protein [Lichenifustis flavocetrariae]MCW6509269.1 YciI family protein [Lichenifustis flavocetrariae]